jgi:hypothetical protein
MVEDWLPITESSGATAVRTHSQTCALFARTAMGFAMVIGADGSCRGRGFKSSMQFDCNRSLATRAFPRN